MHTGECPVPTECSFIDHLGVGDVSSDPWLITSGKRIKLDVLLCLFTRTLTWSFDTLQEYALVQQILEYRDWLEYVVGHNLRLDLHLLLYDYPLARDEISELYTDQFWLSTHDVWQLLQAQGITPSTYDLVWCAWAWENSKEALLRYSGSTSLGPERTPFMSFPVSRFWPGEPGPYLIIEHEAQHTYEFLWAELGYPLITAPDEDLAEGWPHADYLPRLLRSIVSEEPGIFAPLASDEEVLQYSELKMLPSRLQSAVHAWVLRRWPRKKWLELAPTFGTVVAPVAASCRNRCSRVLSLLRLLPKRRERYSSLCASGSRDGTFPT